MDGEENFGFQKSPLLWAELWPLKSRMWGPDPQDLRMGLHLEMGVFKEMIKLKWGHKGGP